MSINTNIDFQTIRDAYSVLVYDNKLVVHTNRDKTTVTLKEIVYLDPEDQTVIIDNETRREMLRHVVQKIEPTADFFFQTLSGETRYTSKETMKRFIDIALERHPDLQTRIQLAVIDKTTNVQLIASRELQSLYKQIANLEGVKSEDPAFHLTQKPERVIVTINESNI